MAASTVSSSSSFVPPLLRQAVKGQYARVVLKNRLGSVTGRIADIDVDNMNLTMDLILEATTADGHKTPNALVAVHELLIRGSSVLFLDTVVPTSVLAQLPAS